jgi:hypothetical protein
VKSGSLLEQYSYSVELFQKMPPLETLNPCNCLAANILANTCL